jgi:hypothetical protein
MVSEAMEYLGDEEGAAWDILIRTLPRQYITACRFGVVPSRTV